MKYIKSVFLTLVLFVCAVLFSGAEIHIGHQPSDKNHLHTKVIKACVDCILPSTEPCGSIKKTWLKAGVWIPDRDIKIYHISIAEESEIALYADIEVSLSPFMLSTDDDVQIFRYKYAGPAIQRNPPCPIEFSGSNTTDSSISFIPYHFFVPKNTPIYVHMEVYNWTPWPIQGMTQDVTIAYTNAD